MAFPPRNLVLCLILSVFWMSASATSSAANRSAPATDPQGYRHAFALLDAGHPDQAYAYAAHGGDVLLNRVLRGSYMAHPGNDVAFDEMARFIANEPDWPNLKSILMIAEQKMPTDMTYEQVVEWFTAHPAVSLTGFYREIDALNALGQTQNVASLVRARWVEGEFSDEELSTFFARFPTYLTRNEVWARMDRLLWKGDAAGVRHLTPYADQDLRDVADARLALGTQSPMARVLYDRVPSSWLNSPGILYERLRFARRNNQNDVALDILDRAPDDLGNADAWWEERQILIRRKMDERDYQRAYELAAHHGQTDPKTLVQAEFLAGWLALRFLNNPNDAVGHFQKLYDNATTPISRARGAYWLGRTHEALGQKNVAEPFYETAATLNMTFYGQLAEAHLYSNPVIKATPEPAIPTAVRNAFYSRDTIMAAEKLSALGERDRARNFFHSTMENMNQRAEFALLTELAYRMERPDLAIEAAKAANQKNMLITAGGFPLLDRRIPSPPEPAFTHALIRQESMFNADARSTVGATGLMQLMPGTAQGVAKKLGIRYKEKNLNDPDLSLKLGTAFVQAQIDDFNGSYILALAGYNSGPRHVHEWMDVIGDPRTASVDPVDWIEEIPVPETRNYVQRIIENLQVYRARLNGGQAPLLILTDLRR